MDNGFGNTYEDAQEVVSGGGAEGFGHTSESYAKVVFIGRNEDNDTDCWYMLEGPKDKPVKRWISSNYLSGTIDSIRVSNQTSEKHGTSIKLSVVIVAGGVRYAVRSTLANPRGEGTVFSRGLLSQLLVCDGPKIKLIVRPSDQDAKIVFPSIVQGGKTVQEKGSKWIDKDADLMELAKAVAEKLGVPFDDATGDAPPQQRKASAPAQQQSNPGADKAKALEYVTAKLDDAGVPARFREAVLRRILGAPGFTIAKLDMPTARVFKTAITDPATGKATNFKPITDALNVVNPPVDDEFPPEPDDDLPWDSDDDPL